MFSFSYILYGSYFLILIIFVCLCYLFYFLLLVTVNKEIVLESLTDIYPDIYHDLKVCRCILFHLNCFFFFLLLTSSYFSICVQEYKFLCYIYLFTFFLRKSEIILHYCLLHTMCQDVYC